MGKITAKIMRDAKEAKKMGDGGVGGGVGGDGDVNVGGEFDLAGPQSEGRGGPLGLNTGADISGPGGGSMMGGPGITASGPGPEGNVSPDTGGGVEAIPSPKAWEATVEKPAPKGERQAEITRKKRRRSLLTEEEGGVLKTAPIYRRTILGR
jgi:hypothetical protein